LLLRPLRSRRRSPVALPHPPVPGRRRLFGFGSQAVSVWGNRLRRQHLEMRRQAGADPAVRSRQCHADPLQGSAQTQGLGLRDRQAINDAQGEGRSGSPPRDHHARDAARRDRVCIGLGPAILETGGRIELPQGATPKGGSRRRRGFCCTRSTTGRLRFQPSRPAPSLPHQAPNEREENTGTPRRR
jgi:hypothetical protein